MDQLRSPICTVVGHVDHGKSSILDAIKDTNILATEAGGITQAIGASIVPATTIKKKCGQLLEAVNLDLKLPGLLFIDTPGHAAFTNLRKRGGNLADIAILAIDIRDGFKPQTTEAVEILKNYKTPFLIAANKIDTLPGWQKKQGPILKQLTQQNPQVITAFETKMYEIIGSLSTLGLTAERFDRVTDYTKEIALIPTSAKTGDGISELLMVLAALAQKFLEKNLHVKTDGPAQGTVLEVKEEKGLGTTMDVIIYDGCLKTNDQIVIGGMQEPIVTKIRGLFEPASLKDMRDKKSKYNPVKKVIAAMGVKVIAPDIENVVAGMPLASVQDQNLDTVKAKVMEQIEEVTIETEDEGITLKADSIGSLEALIVLFKERNIPIRRATVGTITKYDIIDAEASGQNDPCTSVVLGFNIDVSDELQAAADKAKITLITSPIIYQLVDEYEAWVKKKQETLKQKGLEGITRPVKMRILEHHTFRQSNPAIVGMDILAGTAKTGTRLMTVEGEQLTSIKSLQKDKDSLTEIAAPAQLAVSLPNVTMGRQLHEGDILYSVIEEDEFRKLKEFKQYLKDSEKEVLKEIAAIKRKSNPVWGV